MEEKQQEKQAMTDTKKTKKKEKKYSVLVKANKNGKHYIGFLNFLRSWFIPLYRIVKPFRYYGNPKIGEGAYIYICNHYTLFDCVYPMATTWEGIHIVGKKEVMETPVIGGLARGVKVIPVNRDGSDVRALLDCFKCLKNGQKILIFPEGTRNKTEVDMLPFKHGAAVMAIKTKTPIIPMVIYKKPRLFRCAHILVGDPIELTEYYDKKLTPEDFTEADEKLRKLMLEMREKHTQFLREKKKKGKKA